ncbi:hypothetical protein D1007_26233 [Hordeum vulgare]|nr:hypothetical protein D1007_26233 [Hordeum vulgare]
MPTPKNQKEILNELAATTQFAIDVIEQLTLLYADKLPIGCEGAITFGQCLTERIEKILLGGSNMERDPWESGSVPHPPSPTAVSAIKDWFSRAPASTLSSVDSGICSTYLAKFFDGERLVKPMNKENVDLHCAVLLYDVICLNANLSHLLADVLEFIKTSFHLL